MSESGEETVDTSTVESSTSEQASSTTDDRVRQSQTTSTAQDEAVSADQNDPVKTGSYAEYWDKWLQSIEHDLDGSRVDRTRGVSKYAVTFLVVLSTVGFLLGTAVHSLLLLIPVSLFGSYISTVSAFVAFTLTAWGVAVGGKINDELP